ncbi:hypothetical protein Goklo_017495 [Gossypium klotzschianum]|uniref:Uncharacterized protein n=2 Tax=Gossypium TaxID=3633 RepID=A0A7J8UHP8_9ROSI|nr:hypothetical protein [Gossypium klotzschianum]
MTPKAKMWMKFVCSKIEMPKIGPIHAITYGILQKKQICIATWIYKNMVECTRDLRKGIFFPHLIIELCKREGVPTEWMDKTMNLSRKLLRDDVFKLFILLQTKQKEEMRIRRFQEDDE